MEVKDPMKLLDIATQINVLQKVYNDFCVCAFAEIEECDTKYGGEKEGYPECLVEDADCYVANTISDADDANSAIDDLDSTVEDLDSRIEDIEKRILIRQTMMSLSKRYRLKIKEVADSLTGGELEIMTNDTIYDDVMVSNMSKIVDDIIAKVRGNRQKEGL